MSLPTNTNWDAKAAENAQLPVYVLQIDGITDEFCTHRPIDSGGTVYRVLMQTPTGGGGSIDILDGHRTVQSVQVELLDESDRITDLISTEAAGAPVSTIINREATILAGYIGLDISDYVEVFTGKIRAVRMNRSQTGFAFSLADMTSLLDGEIFSGASDATPTSIEGNVVNVYASILRGVFSTSDPDFPLNSVSTTTKTGAHDGSDNASVLTDSGESWTVDEFVGLTVQNILDGSEGVITGNTATTVTATLAGGTDNDWDIGDSWSIGMIPPTGLGIPDANIDIQRIKDQRDTWHLDDTIRLVVDDPVNARSYLATEFFRIFQAWPTITGGGKIGVSFHTPSLPQTTALVVDETDIVSVDSWERVLSDHLNSFRINGDHNAATGDFDAALYSVDTSEDTTDQTNTGETIQYVADSKWLRAALNGVEIAEELVGRHRIRYLKTPAILVAGVNFTKRVIEEGDDIAVTLRDVPNLFDGTRGLTARLMTVLSVAPAWPDGLLKLTLLDMGARRYGVIAPDAQVDHGSATMEEKGTFLFMSNGPGNMGDGSSGYRFV